MKEMTCIDGKKIRRISRWITIKEGYDITPRHRLYDFCTDEYGRHPYQKGFDPSNGTMLYYFVFRGRKYALEDFCRCNSVFICQSYQWEEKDGLHWMAGVEMSGDIFHPLMIELDEYCGYVRVYEEI